MLRTILIASLAVFLSACATQRKTAHSDTSQIQSTTTSSTAAAATSFDSLVSALTFDFETLQLTITTEDNRPARPPVDGGISKGSGHSAPGAIPLTATAGGNDIPGALSPRVSVSLSATNGSINSSGLRHSGNAAAVAERDSAATTAAAVSTAQSGTKARALTPQDITALSIAAILCVAIILTMRHYNRKIRQAQSNK